MIGKLLRWIVTAVLALIGVALAVANRGPVTVSFDPFSVEAPIFAVTLPIYAVLFAALGVGLVLGWITMWVSQGRHRRRAWEEFRHAREAERALAREKDQHAETA